MRVKYFSATQTWQLHEKKLQKESTIRVHHASRTIALSVYRGIYRPHFSSGLLRVRFAHAEIVGIIAARSEEPPEFLDTKRNRWHVRPEPPRHPFPNLPSDCLMLPRSLLEPEFPASEFPPSAQNTNGRNGGCHTLPGKPRAPVPNPCEKLRPGPSWSLPR